MVKIYGAGSLPLNSPDAHVVLTRDELWQALQRKIRYPLEFVDIMQKCKVHSDKDGVVVREVEIDFGRWGLRPMHETVTCHGDLWIRFAQPDGSLTTNIVSYSPDVNDDTHLVVTYVMEWEFPSIKDGSQEHKDLTKDMSAMALGAVTRSIVRAREMKEEGLLKEKA